MRVVPKPWGREEIFAENERYAGKLLYLSQPMPRGSASASYRIRPGTRHRMSAEIPCVLVEVSSPELDDVVRLEDAYGRAGTTEP